MIKETTQKKTDVVLYHSYISDELAADLGLSTTIPRYDYINGEGLFDEFNDWKKGEKYGKRNYYLFRKIMMKINDRIEKELLEGSTVIFPFQLGSLQIVKSIFKANGHVKRKAYPYRFCDVGKTSGYSYWLQHYRKNNVRKKISPYIFEPKRTFVDKMIKKIEEGMDYPLYNKHLKGNEYKYDRLYDSR